MSLITGTVYRNQRTQFFFSTLKYSYDLLLPRRTKISSVLSSARDELVNVLELSCIVIILGVRSKCNPIVVSLNCDLAVMQMFAPYIYYEALFGVVCVRFWQLFIAS